MSNNYYQEFGEVKIDKSAMREWVKRPGKYDENGKPLYFTEQSHKREADVNEIIKKYDKTGLISNVSRFEAKFGDLTGDDFKTMQDKITGAINQFNSLPSEIRNRFNNNPGELLRFMENENNRDEAIELGLISPLMVPEKDGLGEHVKESLSVEDLKKLEDPENKGKE